VESYELRLRGLTEVTFESCLSLAKECVPPYSNSLPLYIELKRGTMILQTEDQLNAYLSYYGTWHQEKIARVLPHVPSAIFSKPFDLIDWGSGQGVGLLALADYIGSNSENLRNVTLIDPSSIALKRAVLHASYLFHNATIYEVNKHFKDLKPTDFTRHIPVPRIHLFSNVLDMELFRNLDDEALQSFILTIREYAFGSDEYFLCISPCYNNISARFEKFLEIIRNDKLWTLERLFNCSVASSRPTLAADVVHYKSKILDGNTYYPIKNRDSELYDLAVANDVDGLRILVEHSSDINKPDVFGTSALLHAVKGDAQDAVRFLVAHGAEVNARNAKGATALYFAAKSGNIKIMHHLLDSGADTEMSTSQMGTTPLMIAIKSKHESAVRLLLESGCNLVARNARGLSPMKLSELSSTEEIMDLLKEKVGL